MDGHQGSDTRAPARDTDSAPGIRGAALVTGANRGLGRRLALLAGDLGFEVAVNYRTKSAEAERVVAGIVARGGRAFALQADVTDEDQAREAVARAAAVDGGLAVLINNVGNFHEGPLDDTGYDVLREMFESNLGSAFLTSQAAAPLMAARGWGRIVNIGFAGAEHVIGRPHATAYWIAKTGVIIFSKALARTLAATGVTVNVLSPGVLENSVSAPASLPAGRLGTLDEAAAAVAYLLSDEAAYTTGVTIEVAGGWNA